jgi:predicted regulator of Ras-like GTPase activity (Roadblock/LC7/MglB family)
MPNTVRTISPQESAQAAAASTPLNAMTATKTGPRMVSVGATQSGLKTHDLPPAIALALEPKVERGISLQLSEILAQVPVGYIKSEESFDPTRRVLLKALELEKGMADRNPSVALTSIYEQIPDIFMRSVPLTDKTRIPLPFDKVLEQFNRMQIRRDQIRDATVPQVDTPFLIVAIEESEKFGTTIDPIQTSSLPTVKVEPASAESFAAAEPEAAESEKVTPTNPPRSITSIPEPRLDEQPSDSSSPARIPFHLPPKGTGAPASERVPASSGPPVLPSVPSRPKLPKQSLPTEPLRNPYDPVPFDQLKLSSSPPKQGRKEAVPAEPVAEKPARRRKPVPSEPIEMESVPEPMAEAPKDDVQIPLSLRVLLQNLPAFQRKGDPNLAPEDVKVSFPLSLLAGQLASGRVAVSSKMFQDAIPSDHRYLFHIDEQEAPVLLPLQEVLKSIPASAMEMRQDQEKLATSETIVTPFSLQAEEDAKRFDKDKAAPAPEATVETVAKIEAIVEKVDPKQVVARASKLPGVEGCAITFSDGLSLAGNLPAALAADGLCAVAPTLLQKIDKHMHDTKLGTLDSMTLQGTNAAVTFFMHGNICLAALHGAKTLAAETRHEITHMVTELSRTYSEPEIPNVDH